MTTKRTFADWKREVMTIVTGLNGVDASKAILKNADADLAAGNITARTHRAARNWAADIWMEDVV